jgi:hypothetical protein
MRLCSDYIPDVPKNYQLHARKIFGNQFAMPRRDDT